MKRLISVLALVLALALLAGCGGGKKPLPANEELEKLLEDGEVFLDVMDAVDPEIAAVLYGLSEDSGAEIHCWFSASGGTAEEFTLFYCKDDAALTEVRKSVEARLETQKRTFENYSPAEVPKLENALVRVRDRILMLCVATDHKKAAQLLDPYFPA